MNPQHFRHSETQLSTAILSLKSWGWGWSLAAESVEKNSYVLEHIVKRLDWEKAYILKNEVIHCSQKGWSYRRNCQSFGFKFRERLTRAFQNSLYASLSAKNETLDDTTTPTLVLVFTRLKKCDVFICKLVHWDKALKYFPLKCSTLGYMQT